MTTTSPDTGPTMRAVMEEPTARESVEMVELTLSAGVAMLGQNAISDQQRSYAVRSASLSGACARMLRGSNAVLSPRLLGGGPRSAVPDLRLAVRSLSVERPAPDLWPEPSPSPSPIVGGTTDASGEEAEVRPEVSTASVLRRDIAEPDPPVDDLVASRTGDEAHSTSDSGLQSDASSAPGRHEPGRRAAGPPPDAPASTRLRPPRDADRLLAPTAGMASIPERGLAASSGATRVVRSTPADEARGGEAPTKREVVDQQHAPVEPSRASPLTAVAGVESTSTPESGGRGVSSSGRESVSSPEGEVTLQPPLDEPAGPPASVTGDRAELGGASVERRDPVSVAGDDSASTPPPPDRESSAPAVPTEGEGAAPPASPALAPRPTLAVGEREADVEPEPVPATTESSTPEPAKRPPVSSEPQGEPERPIDGYPDLFRAIARRLRGGDGVEPD